MSSKLVGWSRSKKPPYVGFNRRIGAGLRWDAKDGSNVLSIQGFLNLRKAIVVMSICLGMVSRPWDG
jgi:hypothetical protein